MTLWPEISAVFLLGLGGAFGHCAGMCGGFVLAIGRDVRGPRALLGRHIAYHAGKTLTYVFLAVLVAAGFALLSRSGWFASAQMALSIAAGVVMLIYGVLQVMEWRPSLWLQRVLEPWPGCRALATVAQANGTLAAFVTGWLNGFLPCGLVVAMVVQLASAGSVVGAAVGAAAFGVATFPGLFAFGLLAHAWSPRWRRVLVRVTGLLLVLFGAITIVRAFPAGRHWLHQEIIPAVWGTLREWCGM